MDFEISNDYSSLANILKRDLFEGSLFEKKLLVLPSEQVKSWLINKWTEELGIVSGIQFLTLNSSIPYLLSLIKEREAHFLSSVELKVLINHFLQAIEHSVDESLSSYLSVDKEERLVYISEILSKLFQNYSIYGADLISNFKNPKKWQEVLFHKIFYEKNYSFPLKELPVNISKKLSIKIYIFGFTYIPELYLDFFYRLSDFADLFMYYPRITSEFWEDIQSIKAKKYFQKKYQNTNLELQEWASKMFETNVFFAQFGNLGKRYEKVLGNYDLNFTDNYVEREQKNLLNTFQNDILTLAELDESNPVNVEELAPSICIQEVNGSKLEEVKTVYGVIQSLLKKENTKLSDVLVLAPDIDQYLSHIKTIFNRKNGFNDIKVHDVGFLSISNLAKGLEDILSLSSSDWTYDEILAVLDNPLIQSSFEIEGKDIEYFKKILQKSRLRFAYNEDHKNSLVGYKNEEGTWEESFQKILVAYSTFYYDFECDSYPQLFANIGQSDLLKIEPFFRVISSLFSDLKELSQPQLQSLDFYASKLMDLIDKYFKIPDDSIELAAFEVIKSFYLQLKKIDQTTSVSFQYFRALLIKELKKKATLNSHLCDAIQFGSLGIDKWPPFKYTFIIGMHDGAFPTSESKSSLNLLKEADYPSKIQIERFTFLVSLINAQNKLWISYPVQNDVSNLPSSFVQDLQAFLNKHYRINGLSFDEWNKKFHYDPAEKSVKKIMTNKFLPINYPSSSVDCKDLEISTYELSLLAKNPIKFYLQKKYSLTLPDLYESVEEDFFLSPLNKSIFVQDQVTEKKLDQKEIRELSPKGIFQDIAKNQLYQEKRSFEQKSKNLELDLESLFSIELSKEVKTKTIDGKKIYLPAVNFSMGSKHISIVGRIKNIHESGLVLLKEKTVNEWVRNWADILLFNYIADQSASFSNEVIFLKSSSKRDISAFDSTLNLQNFVSYYIAAHESVFPFTKSFITSVLKKDPTAFYKSFNQILTKNSMYQDPYEKWFVEHLNSNENVSFFSIWADYLNCVFNPIKDEL